MTQPRYGRLVIAEQVMAREDGYVENLLNSFHIINELSVEENREDWLNCRHIEGYLTGRFDGVNPLKHLTASTWYLTDAVLENLRLESFTVFNRELDEKEWMKLKMLKTDQLIFMDSLETYHCRMDTWANIIVIKDIQMPSLTPFITHITHILPEMCELKLQFRPADAECLWELGHIMYNLGMMNVVFGENEVQGELKMDYCISEEYAGGEFDFERDVMTVLEGYERVKFTKMEDEYKSIFKVEFTDSHLKIDINIEYLLMG